MWTTENVTFHVCACIVRLKVLICYVNRCLQSFIDNVVFCNTLRSIKAAFLELEKAMYTIATPVPMFTIITPCRYTHSKLSNNFHAHCKLNVNCEISCARA